MTKIWSILTWALESLKILSFDWLLLCKVYNLWHKKVQGSYLSWHWSVMQYLKKNWLVVWRMTWGIRKIFTRALESVNIGTLMGSLRPKQKMYELRIYRGGMCHYNEEWFKIWRELTCRFKIEMRNFMNFDQSTRKFQKFALGSFYPKYIIFQLRKYRGVMFDGTVDWCKIWNKTDLLFQNWHEEFGKFSQAEK